jgi:hypothetical protein
MFHSDSPEVLAAELIRETFVEHRKVMTRWAKLTGQSRQLDSGYIAQHLISILTGKRGSGWRGKGLDTVVRTWANLPKRSYNFQLHPPVGKDSNIATNQCGNLELPLMFWAEEDEAGQVVVNFFQKDGLSDSTFIDRFKH